jgi:hypothetical protein
MKLKTVASLSATTVNGTHRPEHRDGKRMVEAGLAISAPTQLKDAVSKLCCVRRRNPGNPKLIRNPEPIPFPVTQPFTLTFSQGPLTIFLRATTLSDSVEAAVLRKKDKMKKIRKRASAHAKKMMNFDVAVQTTLAETYSDLEGEMASFGKGKMALKTYLQDQFRSRKILRDGKYNTIPIGSDFRSKAKPYPLRMNPHPMEGIKVNNEMQIQYLKNILHVMMAEDNLRPLEPTAKPEDAKLVRQLPVISEQYLNPSSSRLKKLQASTVAAMAQPKDNPWYTRLMETYLGKILWDGGHFRVIAIQYVPNKGKNVYPCWEATTEPVFMGDDGKFIVHDRHLVTMDDGTKKLLKSAEVGFALAEYSQGDDAEPMKLTFADECHAKFLQREERQASKPAALRQRRQPTLVQEARLASKPASIGKRSQPTLAQEARLASKPASIGKRSQPAPAQETQRASLRSSRRRCS